MMKTLKSILLIALTIVSLNVFSQTEIENKSKFSVGIIAGPNFSNWYFTINNSLIQMETSGKFFDNIDGFTLGIIGEYKLNNKLALKSALLTSNLAIKGTSIPNPIDPSDPANLRPILLRSSYHFINVPILLRFNYFENNKVKLFVNGGLINKVLLYMNGKSKYEDNNKEVPDSKYCEFTDYLDYILGLNIESGLEYKLNKDFNLGFYPSFEISILSANNVNNIPKSYILMGLNLSLTYNL